MVKLVPRFFFKVRHLFTFLDLLKEPFGVCFLFSILFHSLMHHEELLICTQGCQMICFLFTETGYTQQQLNLLWSV